MSGNAALRSPQTDAVDAPELTAGQSAGEAGPAELCELSLHIAGMSCAACQAHVQRALAAVPGVEQASVDLLANKALVTGTPDLAAADLTAAIRRAGYDVIPAPSSQPGAQPGSSTAVADAEPRQRALGARALSALLAGGAAMLLSMPLMLAAGPSTDRLSQALMHASMPLLPSFLLHAPTQLLRWVLFALALGTMLFAAPEIYSAAWRAARHRSTNMNTLVALGTLVAFGASTFTTVAIAVGRPSRNFRDVYFEAVILILGFLLAGRWLEARARRRATASLRAFAATETGNARWIAEGTPETLATDPALLLTRPETLLPLDAIAVGDLLRVLPGDRVPLDGIVLAGRSSVDEAMLTGEPLPVTRAPGDKLFSGTLNLDGPLLLRATALGADSMQAQMARLLERARSTRAPLQRLADRVSAVFVPAVLLIAALTFTTWAIADNTGTTHLGYGRALSLAIAVLVVACPCAMGLAVPAAVAVSLGAAARSGMLIKGGEALERLAGVDTVALDKTGTLTEGKPHIVAFAHTPDARFPDPQLLRWAAAVEGASTHPLAAAVLAFCAEHTSDLGGPAIQGARVLPGIGAEALVDGRRIALGSAALLTEAQAPIPPAPADAAHATAMYLLVDGHHQATFYATDTLRPSARQALAELNALRLHPIVLTGDTAAAAAIATEAGLNPQTSIRARLLPAEKLDIITELQAQGHRVAMVGDGLNDAAALAHADAGIAMAAGTDLAREAGHVLLLHHDLTLVPAAIRLARRTRRLMRQNLGWALAYNVLGIPLAAGILLPSLGLTLSPALASAAMALSSVSVLLNSLRLARPPR